MTDGAVGQPVIMVPSIPAQIDTIQVFKAKINFIHGVDS